MRRILLRRAVAAALFAAAFATGFALDEIRIGYFPNITHAQALVARSMAREGRCPFAEALGRPVEWHAYNAGPSAMDDMLHGDLDFSYVGPSPVLGVFFGSGVKTVGVLAGSACGGSALLVRPDGSVRLPRHLRGRKIATPQLHNTQDIMCRNWLLETDVGYRPRDAEGAIVVPTPNMRQLDAFVSGEVDAVWTVEPWVSLLERRGGARIFFEEPRDAVVAVLAVREEILYSPDDAQAVLDTHRRLTRWMRDNPEEAKARVNSELVELLGEAWRPELTDRAWDRIDFTDEITVDQLAAFVAAAHSIGIIGEIPDVSRLLVKIER